MQNIIFPKWLNTKFSLTAVAHREVIATAAEALNKIFICPGWVGEKPICHND